ncbi:MAG: S9 family peptidase [Flavobacteriales bacterium]|jgi:dipeptidyl aminopeptidase/acylaminoacyl peptidase
MKLIFLLGMALFCLPSVAQQNFSPEKLWELNRLGGGDLSPDKNNILYSLSSYDVLANKGNADLYVYNLEQKKSTQITKTPSSEFEAKWTKNGEIVFLALESGSGNVQLWKINTSGGDLKLMSNINGGIDGYVLSPQEDKIVLLRSVKTEKTIQDIHPDLPLANARIENDLMYRHWNHWEDEFKTHLFLHDFSNSKVSNNGIDLLEGEAFDGVVPPFSGSEGVVFSGNGNKVYYTSKKLGGKEFATSTNSDVYEYSIESGNTINYTADGKGYDNSPAIHPNNIKFSWLRMERNGFEADRNVIHLKDLSSGKIISVNLSIDLTVSDFQWEADGESIIFSAPYRGVQQLFSHDLKSNVTTQLTTGRKNVVHYSLAEKEIVLGMQSMLDPTDLFVYNRKKKDITQITFVNAEEMKNITKPTIEERWIKNSEGKDMLTWVLFPPNFDANKKYPTLLYCQGGPQSMVSQFFSYRWNLMLMASQGYIIVAPNRTGLPGFGQEWNDDISKDWGGQPMRDYLTAIDEVSKETYVDKDKRGAVGASYGGYSIYYLAGIHENRFKTFIAHCGLFNLESWYGTTEELFFANWDIGGPYWDPKNKYLYEKNSPHKMVNKWTTPLLVIHGGMDFRVPEGEGMQAFQAAQLMGLKSRYLYFPTEGHWIQKPQNGMLWQREFFKWLAEDLK